MRITPFVAEALGDSSYLVVSEGVAAVVDPQRDVRPYLHAAAEQGAQIKYVFETHVHNDYISGGRELAALGAEVVAPEGSKLAFPHRPIADGEEVAIGSGKLRAVAAPGHTYEHTAYLAVDANGGMQAAFTGGAVLMGAAGRSDLLGPDHTEELTRLQWESAHRLSSLLPRTADIFPTHGAGSFCSSTSASAERCGPLALELERNPVLALSSFEDFRRMHLSSRAPTPAYYREMAPINRQGAAVFGDPPVPKLLAASAIEQLLSSGTALVDVRSRFDFVTAHIPGSIEIEDGGSLLAYASWLLPFTTQFGLVTYDQAQAERVTVDFWRIGYESVRGYIPLSSWIEAGRPLQTMPTVSITEARGIIQAGQMRALDVRFDYEMDELPLAGSTRQPVDRLLEWAPDIAPEKVLLTCGSGQRATMAASVLRRRGVDAIPMVTGGAADL